MVQPLVTSDRINDDPESRDLLDTLTRKLSEIEGVLYYDFPKYSDYDEILHQSDLLVVTEQTPIFAIKVVSEVEYARQKGAIDNADESLTQFVSILLGRLLKSKLIRKGRTGTIVDIVPVIFSPASKENDEKSESEILSSVTGVCDFIYKSRDGVISGEQFSEIRSVIEGAKALSRPQRRDIDNPDIQQKAKALFDLESEIANFDQRQRQTALSVIQGPQRVRGLAGSGKTIILAMKAAHLHLSKPDAKILFTFYTKSLRTLITKLITRFYRHYKEEDPDWDQIHIRHGWGGKNRPGVYSDACYRQRIMPLPYNEASKKRGDPFANACEDLMSRVSVKPEYDYVLIDEGQDFPAEFYVLCFYLAHGDRDRKNIIWAYDELQNILNVHIPKAEELFGYDDDGEPRISLDRSAGYLPVGVENDIVLSKCYRNQREVLVIAHALGFGVYGHPVQMLEDEQHWEVVGYSVENPPLEVGKEAVIFRPPENSPLDLNDPSGDSLIYCKVLGSLGEEAEFVVQEIRKFLDQGLKAEDILVVSLDDRNARTYFKNISSKLGDCGIATNNIIADPYSEPPFVIEDRVTLSTVYRAKGNEAAVVFAVGIDAVNRKLRGARNRVFTTFTRSKAWLRVSGLGENAEMFVEEIREAQEYFPYLRFEMPDRENIETIQRDMSEKVAKAKEIKEKYVRELKELGLTEEEIGGLITEGGGLDNEKG